VATTVGKKLITITITSTFDHPISSVITNYTLTTITRKSIAITYKLQSYYQDRFYNCERHEGGGIGRGEGEGREDQGKGERITITEMV